MKTKILFLLCLFAFQFYAHSFGISGSDGQDGSAGWDGDDGRPYVIHATGERVNIVSNGSDGSEGSDGRDGSDAFGCTFYPSASNEYGASGGDGGNGGKGGDGGNGGDITIHYKKITDLRNIQIENTGGESARGGRGAYPGDGCACDTRSWTEQTCSTQRSCTTVRRCRETGETRTEDGRTAPVRRCEHVEECEPHRVCEDERYTCADGDRGSYGRDGADGTDGFYGTIKLVKNLETLPSENPYIAIDLLSATESEIGLSKIIWNQKTGLRNLLAQGSNTSDRYLEFERLSKRKIIVNWDVDRRIEDFSETKLNISFDGANISYQVIGKEVFIHESQTMGSTTVIKITQALKKDELANLSIDSIKGFGDNIVITVKDAAMVSKLVKTNLRMQFVYKPKWRFSWRVVYDKEVPQEFIRLHDDRVEILAGKLKMYYKSKWRGNPVRFTLWVNRSLGGKKEQVKLFQASTRLN